MLTKSDKKYINDLLKESFRENNKTLVKEMISLFNVSNQRIDNVNERLDGVNKNLSEKIDSVNKNLSEKIDDTNERIDKVFDHLSNDFDSIEDHEKRIGKIEEKVFVITTGS